MTCKLCQEAGEVISLYHTSPRECAFRDGTFDANNYCCSSLIRLIEYVRDVSDGLSGAMTFSEDEWTYTLPLSNHCLTVDNETLSAICLVIHQYKSRGRITGAWILPYNGLPAMPVTKDLIDQIIEQL